MRGIFFFFPPKCVYRHYVRSLSFVLHMTLSPLQQPYHLIVFAGPAHLLIHVFSHVPFFFLISILNTTFSLYAPAFSKYISRFRCAISISLLPVLFLKEQMLGFNNAHS